MRSLDPIRVFISSKQSEFRDERLRIADVIGGMPLLAPILAEEWSPQRLDVRERFLQDVHRSPIYVGLFGAIYSEPTVLEYETAAENPYREILIYIKKQTSVIDSRLSEFIARLGSKHVYKEFETPEDLIPFFEKHLWDAVRRMIEAYLQLKEPAPVTQGSFSVLKRRWSTRRDQLANLGLPGDLSPASAEEYAAGLSEMLKARSGL
jgi:hypothetical protein